MDNFEDKLKHDANSAGDGFRSSHQRSQHTEIINRTRDPFSITDAKFLPSQLMETGGAPQSPQSAANIFEMMYRFKWTILAIFILVATPAIAAIWTQIIPVYRAKAELRIRPIIPYLVFRTEDNGMLPLYSSFVNTQVSIMRSMTVLLRVLDDQNVQGTQWYKISKKSLKQRILGHPAPSTMERLRSSLKISPRRGTEIMDISFVDTSPQDAKLIVDAVLKQYLLYIGERFDKAKDILHEKISEQYTTLENEIKGREAIIASLRNALGTGTPQELISSMRLRMDDTKARLTELKLNISVLELELAQENTDDSNDVPDAAAAAIEKQKKYYEDLEWRGLERNAKNIQHQIATSLLTRKHPNRTKMEMDLKFAEELLLQREERLDEQWLEQQSNSASGQKDNTPIVPIIITNADGFSYEKDPASLKLQLARLKERETLLTAEIEKQREEFKVNFADAQTMENENNELQHKRDLFKAVRARLDQKNMESNVTGRIEVLTDAFAPSMPHKDRRIVLTAMALFLALCMGGSTAFLKGSINQTIYTHKDMPYPMQIPFLGYIPTNRTKKPPEEEFSPAMIESIRVVRTALLSRLNGHSNSTVLITSSDASTGKSTFTMMLGKSLAQAGKKVLIIDADFRKITLTKRFNLPNKSGFLESLSSRSVDKRHIFPTETFGLSIMPAGKRSNDEAVFEETANGAFKACISQLQKQYNIILLDSSPILPVADATILSSQVDGTIMVERELVSQRANVINALARLGSAGGRLLGTVFVGSNNNEGYGYGYSYSRTNES